MIIDIQCVQTKCIWRLFAKNLNNFNIELFGQTVYYSVSPSSNVPFNPLESEDSSPISCSASLLLYFSVLNQIKVQVI